MIHSNKVLKLEKKYNLAKEKEANIKKELAPKDKMLKPEKDKVLEAQQSLGIRHNNDNDARGVIANSVQSFRDKQEATSKSSAILPGK